MVPRHVSRPTSTLGRRMRRAARRRLEPVPTARQVRDRRRWNPPRSREGPRTSAIRPAYGCGEDRDTPGFGGWDLTAMVAAGRCKMDESTTPVDQLLRFPLVDALFGRRSRDSVRACRSRQDRRRSSREGRRFGRILLVWTVSTKRSARHTARTCGLRWGRSSSASSVREAPTTPRRMDPGRRRRRSRRPSSATTTIRRLHGRDRPVHPRPAREVSGHQEHHHAARVRASPPHRHGLLRHALPTGRLPSDPCSPCRGWVRRLTRPPHCRYSNLTDSPR